MLSGSVAREVSMPMILLDNLVCTRNFCTDTKNSCEYYPAMTIHQRLKEARIAKKLTMKELARLVGVDSYQTIQQWENGKSAPKRDRMEVVAEALGVAQEWLLFGTDQNKIEDLPGVFPVSGGRFREIPVIGKGMGGIPDRAWTDGDFPAGCSDQYAEVATNDVNAFIFPVEGDSMAPRYNPGEYALVEPNTDPEIEDDVLVRLGDGRTLIKRLLSRRGQIRLGSYNSPEIISAPPDTIIWMYYVAHPVPARKIKQRT